MALSSYLLSELMMKVKPGMSIASMGYPDIIATPDEISAIVGNVKLKYLPIEASERHGVTYRIPDAHDFFKSLDIELDVYDIVKERGSEILCDLNEPQYLDTSYDVVIDIGTLEHCFNIGQALMNMAALVREDGYIIHENPFNWLNHGFYGLNPTLFYDFYEQNGFSLISCVLIERESKKVHPAPFTQRCVVNGGECNLVSVARCNSIEHLRFPIQTKYKQLLGE